MKNNIIYHLDHVFGNEIYGLSTRNLTTAQFPPFWEIVLLLFTSVLDRDQLLMYQTDQK